MPPGHHRIEFILWLNVKQYQISITLAALLLRQFTKYTRQSTDNRLDIAAFETAIIYGKAEQIKIMTQTLKQATPAMAEQLLQWTRDCDYEKIPTWIEQQRKNRLS